ncbi:uncharacterized protein LOC111354400 [Spodoptera litura]|uniref:Uncharacterized protein LOC111354400 n=1 Tax=Spodoptera litura TaxID=69820 RepID=A0A9J7E813_SPOLT|nr:uncharacterized protein LOC111354400 [Spodoptera litura]XP_022823612.1 uncharacterized protein LOC111354400 [Spodoptera litura]
MISEFAKEKVYWTRKMNLKLVKFMESRPNIWNPKHPKYTSLKYRDKTYAEFASLYGNEFTGQIVKDRWTNIRSTFANYLRKVKASQAKGDGELYKVTWHLWDACKFLLKVNKNIQGDANDCSNNDLKDETEQEDLSSNSDNSEKSYNSDPTCQNIANGILNVFRGVQNDVFGLENTKYGQVGQLVAQKLSQMSSYEAAQMSNKITEILLMYHEDNPLNPNNLKSELNIS